MDQVYHFIGIGGIGMSALARILLEQGKMVQGSDNAFSPITAELEALGARIFRGQSYDQIPPSGIVIYSTDIKEDNPEYKAAIEKQRPMLHRSELLAELMRGKLPLLVTGTHGKTTTTSLLSHVLMSLGWEPSCAIGGVLKNISANSRSGHGEYFVAEADESDGSFLSYPCFGAIITNIDLDHLNHWKSEEALIAGFQEFAARIVSKDHLLWCKDDKRLCSLGLQGISYGYSLDADVRIFDSQQMGPMSSFSLVWNGVQYRDIQVPLIGRHNALNTAAVFALALKLGAKESEIRKSLQAFQGVGRRADKIGEVKSISFYDDYGHHPTEIKATLEAFKSSHPDKRLVTIFQPHRYSRTKDCLEEFAAAFDDADIVVLTDLYAAGEHPLEGITSEVVYAKVAQVKKTGVYYLRKDALVEFLTGFLQEKDIVVTMGAGDITKYGPFILKRLTG